MAKARRRRVPAFGEWNYNYHHDEPVALPPAVVAPAAACYATPEPESEACSDVWFRYSPPPRKPTPKKKHTSPRRPEGDVSRERSKASWDAAAAAKGGGSRRVVRPFDGDLYQIGLRWRTEKEVISGKGQFICGNRKCDENNGLGSYEVNFSYVEAGEQKQALVKLVACKRCAEKLAYKRQKEKEKEMDLKGRDKRKREHDDESEDTIEDESAEKRCRRKKDRKGTSKRNVGNKDEGFEAFLEGMFP